MRDGDLREGVLRDGDLRDGEGRCPVPLCCPWPCAPHWRGQSHLWEVTPGTAPGWALLVLLQEGIEQGP